MDPTRTLPPELVEAARAYADGSKTPAEPRSAATVVLVRPGATVEPGALEVYLLRRHVAMAFAAGMSVFPGGGVDPRDADLPSSLWTGPSPAEWAARMGCSSADAAVTGLRCGAGDVRGVGGAAGRYGGRRRGRHDGSRGGASRAGVARAVVLVPARRPGLGAPHRPVVGARWLADAGVRAEALPDLVLRRRHAHRSGDAGRVDRVRDGRVDVAARHHHVGRRRGRC